MSQALGKAEDVKKEIKDVKAKLQDIEKLLASDMMFEELIVNEKDTVHPQGEEEKENVEKEKIQENK